MPQLKNIAFTAGSILLGITGMAEAAILYLEFSYIGFPDGHRSVLDRAREVTYPIFMAIACLLTAYAMYTSTKVATAASRQSARRQFVALVSITGLVNLVCVAIDYVCGAVLRHSGVG